jgi:nucleoporin GLE1
VYHNKQQQRAWERAQASHNRDLVALRTIRLNAFTQAEQARRQTAEDELELVRLVLEDFDIRRQKEEERVDREFKERNNARWDEINQAISKLEQEASAAEQAKKKQKEAEERAKQLREQEQAKIQKENEERERAEKEKHQSQKDQAAKAAEERAKKVKEEEQKAAATSTSAASASTSATASTSPAADSVNYLADAKAQFERWHGKIQEIKTTVLPAVSGNPSLKNACWKLKRSLTTRISNVSASAVDIKSTAEAIHASLTDAKSNPQAYLWCLNLLSKKIIEMAGNNSETDLSPVTYALGQVIVALFCADHAEFADILMARLVKRCPYVIP